MRPLEWAVAAVVLIIAVQWLRGRRAPLGLAILGAALVVIHVLVEGQRVIMWPAYLTVAAALLAAFRSRPREPKGGALRVIGRGLGFLVVVLLGVVAPWLWPVMKLPKPTGRYGIGTSWIVVRDSSRRERFGAGRGGPREVPVKLWYPVAAGTKGPRAKYAEPAEPSMLGMIPTVLNRQVALIETHAIADAPIEPSGRFPVVIFSHGYTGYAAQNTPQMEELASRGYLVASIAHVGEASSAPFPDGKALPIDTGVINGMRRMAKGMTGDSGRRLMDSLVAAMAKAADPAERVGVLRTFLTTAPEPLRTESVAEWSLDTKATLDLLAAMDAGTVQSPFQGRLDLERVGVSGMSYGGATAGEFCYQDRRCKAAVNIDGGQYGTLVNDSLMVPLLILASEQAYGVHVPVLDLSRGPAYLARVPATTHMGLTDATLQAPRLFAWIGLIGKLDPDRREEIMTGYVVEFFEKYLGGHPNAFDGLGAKFPEVSVVSRNVTEIKP